MGRHRPPAAAWQGLNGSGRCPPAAQGCLRRGPQTRNIPTGHIPTRAIPGWGVPVQLETVRYPMGGLSQPRASQNGAIPTQGITNWADSELGTPKLGPSQNQELPNQGIPTCGLPTQGLLSRGKTKPGYPGPEAPKWNPDMGAPKWEHLDPGHTRSWSRSIPSWDHP